MFHYLRRAAPHFAAEPLNLPTQTQTRPKSKSTTRKSAPIKRAGPQTH
jgi:hypothetical protein